MNTELATTENPKALAAQVGQAMTDMGVKASDLVIPRLLLMQNTSEAVGDDKAKLGDILNSQTGLVIGGMDKPIDFIPLNLYKTWRVMNTSGKQAEFVREEPVTAKNQDREWTGTEEIKGVTKPVRYDFSYNFFLLLKKEVDEDEAFPAVLTLRRTSARAGKSLATHLFKMATLGQKPYSKLIRLSVSKQKHETNTYGVFEIQPAGKCTAKELEAAAKWMPLLSQMRVDEDRAEPEAVPAEAPYVMTDSSDGSTGPY